MTCPICGKPVAPGAQFVPFCSGRCRLIDLANWADEKYRIPATTHPAAEDEAEENESEK